MATHKLTRTKVAIKHINQINWDIFMTKNILRELILMRKFSEIKDNVFTSKVFEIILPENTVTWIEEEDIKLMPFMKNFYNPYIDYSKLNHLFIVMELGTTDLKKMLDCSPSIELDHEHILIIMYNMLCALNFIHSAGIIHRDLKPANILIG
jgi:serine/threonine protein kinase